MVNDDRAQSNFDAGIADADSNEYDRAIAAFSEAIRLTDNLAYECYVRRASVYVPWGKAPNLVSNLYRPIAHLADNHGFHTRPRACKVSSLGLRGE